MTAPLPDLAEEYQRRCRADSDIREYLPLLHGYARLYPAVRVLEVGVRSGNSTVAFLLAAQAMGGHVWSVDIDDVRDRPEGIGPWRDHPAWTFTQGDSTHPAVTSKQPRPRWPAWARRRLVLRAGGGCVMIWRGGPKGSSPSRVRSPGKLHGCVQPSSA